jgi:hypothetical protein
VAPWFCLCCRKLYSAYCRSVVGSAKERKSSGISNILLSNMTNEFLEEEFGNQIAFVLWLMCSWKRNLGTKLFCVAFQARYWIHVNERAEFEGLEFIKTFQNKGLFNTCV